MAALLPGVSLDILCDVQSCWHNRPALFRVPWAAACPPDIVRGECVLPCLLLKARMKEHTSTSDLQVLWGGAMLLGVMFLPCEVMSCVVRSCCHHTTTSSFGLRQVQG